MRTRVVPALAFLLLAVLPASSQQPAAQHPDMARKHDQGFGKFVDDYFAAAFAYSPEFGTQAGFHQYDEKVTDRSRARVERRIAEVKTLLARLRAFDRAALSF